MPPSRDASRKIVILTGASGGIGALIAQRLVAQGHIVVALCRTPPPFESPDLRHVACDLGETGALAEACATIEDACPSVYAVIHCAGTIVPSPLSASCDRAISRQIAVNLEAPMLLTRRMLPLMRNRRDGARLVFVNSMAAAMPLAGSSVYAATKAGLRSFALSLAQELQSENIAVCSVFPGAVQTGMLQREMEEGGSMLNFVSTPLAPECVADAVIRLLARPRAERFLPAIDGVFGRLCMLSPRLLHYTLPLLTFLGRRGYRRATRGL